MTPLYTAAVFGYLDIVKFLVSNGADVNEEHDKGMIASPRCSYARGHMKVMEYLIQQESDVNKKDNDRADSIRCCRSFWSSRELSNTS